MVHNIISLDSYVIIPLYLFLSNKNLDYFLYKTVLSVYPENFFS